MFPNFTTGTAASLEETALLGTIELEETPEEPAEKRLIISRIFKLL